MVDEQTAGTGTIFPAKRTSNGLHDLGELHFVVGKLSQSPGSVAAKGVGIPLAWPVPCPSIMRV